MSRHALPDIALLEGVIDARILGAARMASEAMTRSGIRHVLIGCLAVGAYGYVRATKDVDFLVGSEGFEHHGGGIVTLKVPIEVNGVPVDSLAEDALRDEMDSPVESRGIPVVSVGALFLLKLKAHR